MKTDIETTELATIDITSLEGVTGGGLREWAGQAWNWASSFFGGGGGGGSNTNIGIGNNQRTAQGNQGPVSQGDNSPITVNQAAPQQ
jgi:hypothetical protein